MSFVEFHAESRRRICNLWNLNVNSPMHRLTQSYILKNGSLRFICSLNIIIAGAGNDRIVQSMGAEAGAVGVIRRKLQPLRSESLPPILIILRSRNHNSLSLRWPRVQPFALAFEFIIRYDLPRQRLSLSRSWRSLRRKFK